MLWDEGEQAAALGVESLWDELLGRQPFQLLSAYPAAVGADPLTLAGLSAVHSAVEGAAAGSTPGKETELARRSYEGSLDDPARARRFVVGLLRTLGLADVAHAALVVTELATNTLIHAGTPFTVHVLARPRGVRIAVADSSTALPVPRDDGLPDPGGHGLRLVAALAAEWGTSLANDGTKTVWAELVG